MPVEILFVSGVSEGAEELVGRSVEAMGVGLLWASAEDIARNKPAVRSAYRCLLRALNLEKVPLSLAARESKKAEVRHIFELAASERSVHNIRELLDIARHSVSLLEKGEIPGESR